MTEALWNFGSGIFAGGLSSNTPDIHMFEYSTPDHQMEKTKYKHGSLRYPQPFSPKRMWQHKDHVMKPLNSSSSSHNDLSSVYMVITWRCSPRNKSIVVVIVVLQNKVGALLNWLLIAPDMLCLSKFSQCLSLEG